ncbi:MAG: TIGR04076 family protein, partial [Clostridia bacterium]|nr:TIGR04076 family protein [Clostridia bacterium]
MYKVRIKAVRQADYKDLQEQFENPIEHACDVKVGDEFVSVDGKKPAGLCESAWDSIKD